MLQELGRGLSLSFGGIISEVAPYALVCVGFTVAYWFVPNTKVNARAALTGGVVAGVTWAGTGALLAAFVVNAATTISIYSSFAIVITSLFWLYLSWLILLVGAQLAFYVQHPDYMPIGYRPIVASTAQRERLALAVMLLIARAFRTGAPALNEAAVADALSIPGLTISPVVEQLEAAGLLARTADDGFLPQRQTDCIRLQEILNAVRNPLDSDIGPGAQWPPEVAELADRLQAGIDDALGAETLANLAEPRTRD